MLYSFELQLMGVILLTAMCAGGVSLWYKKRKLRKELKAQENNDEHNF
ncbi:MAG: hypothetical protein MAG458_00890 [Nitrosopumilus sp.]|nr:hypothetical protein [Nitrosopumilus sp.]